MGNVPSVPHLFDAVREGTSAVDTDAELDVRGISPRRDVCLLSRIAGFSLYEREKALPKLGYAASSNPILKEENEMRNKRIWVTAAFAANLLLLPLVLATPAEVRASSSGWLKEDCCKESVEEVDYCCDNCCWFNENCNSSSDCRPDPK